MSQNINNPNKALDLLSQILTHANTTVPISISAIASIIGIVKSGLATGKTDAEIVAEATDSMATALRVKEKAENQMGPQG